MDIRQLRHFVTVADVLHFGRAAEQLHMTQPPLSQSIRLLEQDLGIVLFTRTRRSVALTAVGKQFLPHARKVLEDAQKLPETARRLSRGEIGTLRIDFVSTAAYSLLPGLVSGYKARFPEVDIQLREATSDVQIEALLSGTADAGLLIAPPGRLLPAPLTYRMLRREPLIAAVPLDWVETGKIPAAPAFDAISDAPLILFPRHGAPALHDLITGYYARHGAAPVMGQAAMQMQTIVSLVAAGLGIALVPESLRDMARTGVAYLPLSDTPPVMETGLAWRRDNDASALAHLVSLSA
ncbi:LysR family transcriptional regulator [Iodidimonas sp. SYSU 1G8]|uniref:LysR family transcriptional regulator n=1 Tax=Iodidimonas sp. SYSU 1G8 TaxID=3133967 RepID=UPI0031FE4FED